MLPPEPCPPEVLSLVEGAVSLHNNGQYDAALEAYSEAQEHWEDPAGGNYGAAVASDDIHRGLYFCLATGSVLLSAGRYEEALERYEGADAEAKKLPEGHPNRAVVHSCRAFALNALSRLDLAFEELVKVWEICVIRKMHAQRLLPASLRARAPCSHSTHSSDPSFPALTFACPPAPAYLLMLLSPQPYNHNLAPYCSPPMIPLSGPRAPEPGGLPRGDAR